MIASLYVVPFLFQLLTFSINTPNVVYVKGGWMTLGYTEKMTNTLVQKWVPPSFDKADIKQKLKHNKIKIDHFYISKYEVTNQEYCNFLNQNKQIGEVCWFCPEWTHECKQLSKIKKVNRKYEVQPGFEQHPVICVTWHGAVAYCNWVGGRLPTSAEWEYAARGGQKSKEYIFSGSDEGKAIAVFNTQSPNIVGSKKPNELGIFDMSGNVNEWCSDWFSIDYHMDYKIPDNINPVGPASGDRKVLRGSSWRDLQDLFLQVPNIRSCKPSLTSAAYGFRVCYDKIK